MDTTTKKTFLATLTATMALLTWAVPLQLFNLQQEINTNGIQVVNNKMVYDDTNDVIIIHSGKDAGINLPTNGITFLTDESIKMGAGKTIELFTDEFDTDCEHIYINGKALDQIIAERATTASINALNQANPLWGKKLAVVGDSEAQPSTSYPERLAARNNMVLVNKAKGGSGLVGGPESETALLPNHLDWIPKDSDYIIVHIGYNDGWDASVDDDSTATNTFKGAWNTFLGSIKVNYPLAKKLIMIPYHWNPTREERAIWMMSRCDKYSLEYFDGTVEYGFNPTNNPHYFGKESGDVTSLVHFSGLGHERASYDVERMLKTRAQFSK